MNVVIITGRITKDLEVRYTPSQMAVTSFTLAVDRPVKKGEEKQADFVRCTVFGKQAEMLEKWSKKGNRIAIEGRIQTGSYQNKNGEKVYTTDVIANRVEIIDWPEKDGENGNQTVSRATPEQVVADSFAAISESVPF